MAKLFNPITRYYFQNLILEFVNNLCDIKKNLI